MKLVQSYKLFPLFKIPNESGNVESVQLWPSQIDYLRNHLYKHRKIIILKARQKGFTLMHGIDSGIQACFQKFRTVVISKGEKEAAEFLEKTKTAYESMDEQHQQVLKLKFFSDYFYSPITKSEIISLPSSGGRSITCNRVVIDEAAYIKKRYNGKIDLESMLTSLEPTIEKLGGQIILMTTADGKDMFYDKFDRAMAGNSNYSPFFFSCYDDPTYTKEMRQAFILDNGEEKADQEYPITWRDAFLSSGSPRFDKKALRYYEENAVAPIALGDIDSNGDVLIFEKGPIRFYQKKQIDGQYLLIVDASQGLEHGDYSCIDVYCRRTGKLISQWHGHIEDTELGSVSATMGRHYNNAIIAIETGVSANGVAAIGRLIEKEKYPKELIHQSEHSKVRTDDKFKDPHKRFGWITNRITKANIVSRVAAELIRHEIPYLSKEQVGELWTFIRYPNGSVGAESGRHDDRVMTLCIGRFLLPFYPPKDRSGDDSCENCKHRKYFEQQPYCGYSGKIIKDEKESWCSEFSSAKLEEAIIFKRFIREQKKR